MCENVCRPYGTRIYFPRYPALRLRLRAGLDLATPMALDFPLGKSTRKYQVWFSQMLFSPCKEVPQGLKPKSLLTRCGTSEDVP